MLRSGQVSQGWWHRFLERQKDISLRQGDTTAHVRMDAMNRDTVEHYFSLLHDVLSSHDLLDKPAQLYNVDESGVPLNPRPPKVVSPKGREMKKVRYRCSGRKGQITSVACANAAGQAIPPMVIYNASKLNPDWTKGEVVGTKYGLSMNGWINTDLFEAWFMEHFIPNAVSSRPLFLLLDGHSTHYQPQVLKFAMEHQCIILCLPPHTTHETQPLDVGIFAPLKVQWGRVCHNFYQKNPGKIVNKFNFNTLFSEAWYGAVTSVNIMAGFRKAGVFPFNPNAVTISTLSDKSAEQHSPEAREASPGMSTPHCLGSESVSASESNECVSESGIPKSSVSDPSLLEAHVSDYCTHQDSEPQMCDPTETTANNSQSVVAGPSFSQEQRRRYQIRYEEGFDVVGDPNYVSWLRIKHPDSPLLRDHMGPASSGESLLNHFSDVTPVEEIAVNLSPTDKTPTNKTTVSNFSKFLIPPQVSTPTGPKRQPPRARLLTSSAALDT